jgi:hypothetical protein
MEGYQYGEVKKEIITNEEKNRHDTENISQPLVVIHYQRGVNT